KLETGDWVRDIRRAPVIDREIQAGDARKSYGSRFPARRVVGFGPIIAIANIVEDYFVAVDLRPPCFSNVRLPGAIVPRLQRKPPPENNPKSGKDGEQLSRSSTNEKKSEQKESDKANSCELAQFSNREIVIERTDCPQRSDQSRDPNQSPNDQPNKSHQKD